MSSSLSSDSSELLNGVIQQPLQVVQRFFAKVPVEDLKKESDWDVPDFFSKILRLGTSESLTSMVPSLNDIAPEEVKPNSLVRFRCMVQDTLRNEIYLNVLEQAHDTTRNKVRTTGKYRDVVTTDPFHTFVGEPSKGDRLVLSCVEIPGEQAWVKRAAQGRAAPVQQASSSEEKKGSKKKRRRAGDDDMEVEAEDSAQQTQQTRARTSPPESGAGDAAQPADGKRTTSTALSTHRKCVVKVYDGHQEQFKVGDTVEFLGVLSVAPELDYMDNSSGPAGGVTRLHCITFRKLSHGCPVPSRPLEAAELHKGRASTISILRAGLGCSEILAELLLCHMISHVMGRQPGKVVGSVCMGLEYPCRTPEPPEKAQNFAARLTEILSLMLPKVKVLQMTPEALNAVRFAPQKDYDKECLLPGELQLSPGTHVLADETHISPGRLEKQGVLNLRTLSKVIQEQKLEYDFEFYQSEMPVDLPVLLVSRGKSLLQADMRLELPTLNIPDTLPAIPEEIWTLIRRYLLAARDVSFALDEKAGKMATETFVKRRQQDASLSSDWFDRALTLARLQAMSRFETSLSPERWRQANILVDQAKRTPK
eukprot:g47264.t1